MGLIKLGLVGAAGYAIARKVNAKHNASSNTRDIDERPAYRDTSSGYQHQGWCNGRCDKSCNGQQTYGLHDWTCNGQCAGRCATQQRQAAGAMMPAPPMVGGGAAHSYYAAGGLGAKESLPSYDSGRAAPAVVGDAKI